MATPDPRITLTPRASPLPGELPKVNARGPLLAAAALAVVFGALILVLAINAVPVPLPIAFAAGVMLIGITLLAIGRYEAAVALGFLLSGVVKIEPAPPDGIFAIVIIVALVTGRLRLERVPVPAVALLGLLTAISVLSFAAAISIPLGMRFFAITLYLFAFAVWLSSYADRDRRGRQIVLAWLTIAVISAILGTLALQFAGFPMRLELISSGSTRASALFKDPNVYGPFLVPITVILIEELISPRLLRIRPIFGFLLIAILVIGLIYSFSRAAWANMLLSTAIMFAVVLLRRRSGRRIAGVIGGLIAVGMAALAFVVFSGQADFIGQRAQLQQYDSERFGAQRAGVALASNHPVGVGPGQFLYHHPVESHSVYVRVLAEQGVLGLAAWIGLGLFTLGLAIANAVRGRTAAGIGAASLLGAWCGLLLNGVVVDTLHWRHLWVVAGLIWAASISAAIRRRARPGAV